MGLTWLCGRRARRIILWLARAFRRPSDRRDRGRADWRKENRESRPGWLGNIPGQPCRHDRKAISWADHDRDFSNVRFVAAVAIVGHPVLSRGSCDVILIFDSVSLSDVRYALFCMPVCD